MDKAYLGQKVLYVHDGLIYTVQETGHWDCIIHREAKPGTGYVQTRRVDYDDLQDASPGTIPDLKAQLAASQKREREILALLNTDAKRYAPYRPDHGYCVCPICGDEGYPAENITHAPDCLIRQLREVLGEGQVKP